MNKVREIPEWLDRNIFPFKNNFLEIEGNTIHYVDEGSGPVLLLLHGNPSWSFLYRHIIKELSDRFRCIALDYPGFGLSSAKQGYSFKPREHSAIVEKFVAVLKLQDIRLMVQDWGGPIGLGFAGRNPDLIHSLFIGNTWAWPAEESKEIAQFSRIGGSSIARFLIVNFSLFASWIHPLNITRKLTRAEKAAYDGPFPTRDSRMPIAIFPHEILASGDYLQEVKEGLEKLKTKPVVILWGDDDLGFKEGPRRRFEQIFPESKTIIMHGAKHFIQEDAPETICREILAQETLERQSTK